MRKVLFLACILILSMPLSAFAAPFLVCDPQIGIEHYVVTGLPSPLDGTKVMAQPDGSLRMDLAQCPIGGPYTITIKACTKWECSTATNPFVFSRPGGASVPVRVRIE